jgi:hypothetical protein
LVVIQQTLNQEIVERLLAEGGESELLDYKRTIDLNETSDCVELAKDIAAMQVDGGYIVIGVDDAGKLTGKLMPDQATLFDESRLRAKLAKYLSEPFTLRTYVYEKDGNWVAAIVTLPNPAGFMIFKADGQYGKGKDVKTVFRTGDVFVRNGSSSKRWSQHDIPRIVERIVEARKESWRRETTEAIMGAIEMESHDSGRIIARGAASAFTWRVDDESFNTAAIELLRAGDTVPFVMLFDRMTKDTVELFDSTEEDASSELGTMLDRLSCLIAASLRFNKFDLFVSGIKTMLRIYMSGFTASGDVRGHDTRGRHTISSPMLWLEITRRVVAIGAYAVRLENWKAVRTLALQTTTDRLSIAYGNKQFWLRHTTIEASMANILSDPQVPHGRVGGELISHANKAIENEPCLRPDLPQEDYRLLRSILEFDLLALLVVSVDEKAFDNSYAYGSFVYWGMYQVEAILAQVILDSNLRVELFGGEVEDQFLADMLRDIQVVTSRMSIGASWEGKTVREFLKRYPGNKQASY